MMMYGLLDPVETQFPLLAKSMMQLQFEGVQAPDWLKTVNSRLKQADAVVVVSAEYNHSIPPALSNMLDYFPPASYAYKPSGIVCYSTGKVDARLCGFLSNNALQFFKHALLVLD